jgi:glycosyltransferase involved in cell wall biosynthesis
VLKWLWKACVFVTEPLVFSAMLVLYFLIVIPYARLEYILLRRRRKPRIVWGTTPITNIRYGSLAARRYGYKSDTVVYSISSINQLSDYDFVIDKYFSAKSRLLKRLRAFLDIIAVQYTTFLWASLKYDIFHFYFDGGFIGRLTIGHRLVLPLLHIAGKKVIVVPYGCEARLESIAKKYKYNFCMYCTEENKTCDEKKTRRYLEHFCKHADIVLGCADLVECFPRYDGMWQYPIELSEWPPADPPTKSEIIKVVHAANHRRLKGTHFLITAIDELKVEGYQVELVIVEKMLTSEAKKIYAQADIIADQFIAGAYALFAIEGMALGKPVICYLNEDWFRYHPEWSECPIVSASPENLKEQLVRLINDSKLRRELGQRGIAYVKKYHSSESVGAELDKLYRCLWNNEMKVD